MDVLELMYVLEVVDNPKKTLQLKIVPLIVNQNVSALIVAVVIQCFLSYLFRFDFLINIGLLLSYFLMIISYGLYRFRIASQVAAEICVDVLKKKSKNLSDVQLFAVKSCYPDICRQIGI